MVCFTLSLPSGNHVNSMKRLRGLNHELLKELVPSIGLRAELSAALKEFDLEVSS
jgi:hypothetical protein